MELIYFYIHRSANHFIEKNGFNFSSKYKFSVTHDDKKCYLTGNKNENSLPERFFDNTECVTNVTAIVGENGSGKTTLLNEILSYSTVSSQMTEILSIYLEGTKLICCHNIGGFENHTDLLQEENIHCLKDGPDEFISRIYISNSTYVDAVDHYDIENSEQVVLNPDEIRRLKNKFFKKGIGHIVGGYYELRDVAILESIKISQFQHILDVLYLEHLYSENIDSTFAEEIGKNLNISFYRIGEYLNDFYGTSQKEENQFQQYHMQMQEVLKKIEYESSEENIFTDLYINLLYELLVYLVCSKKSKDIFEKLISNKEETAKKDLKTLIDKLLREANKDTFKDAFDEIKKYEECLKESQIPNNFSYHNRYIHIKYGNRAYEDFLCLIKESAFHRTTSFVLKYINISGLNLASGERAMLNFFSWLYLMSHNNEIMGRRAEDLQKNVWLLIDELDLYCHPLWQQQMLSVLIDELRKQYPDKKVQIIFTTHSPIILSDVPRCNVIFLKKEDGHCQVDDNLSHRETFGANIYMLFNDAFFLGKEGQIGALAKRKIKALIEKLCPKEIPEKGTVYQKISEEEANLLEKEIAMIGEPILRNKLYDMLYKSRYSSEDFTERKIKIYEKKIEQLKKRKMEEKK